jgi:hypothetical protein
MFNPSIPRENIDAQAESTDGRATLYANGQTHMFGRKVVIKKQRGGFKYKKNKTIYFLFSYLKRYSKTYTFLQMQKMYQKFVTKNGGKNGKKMGNICPILG